MWDANWDKESLRGKVQRLRFVKFRCEGLKPMGFMMDSPGFQWFCNGFSFGILPTIWISETSTNLFRVASLSSKTLSHMDGT